MLPLSRLSGVFILTISCHSLWAVEAQERISLELEGGLVWDSAQRLGGLNGVSSKVDSGWVMGAKVEATRQAEGQPSLTGGYNFSATDYRKQDSYDWALHKMSGAADYDFGLFSSGIGHSISHLQWGAYRLLLNQSRIHAARQYDEHWTILGALDYQIKNVRALPEYDAIGRTLSVSLLRAFADQRGQFSMRISHTGENARSDQFDYTDYSLQTGLSRHFQAFAKETELHLNGAFFNREFSAFNRATGSGRRDTYTLAGIEWRVRLNKYWYVIGRVDYRDYHSTLEWVEYSETLVSARLRLRFE